MSSQPSVLVLGARGRLGFAASQAFARAGWKVHAQVRPATASTVLPATISGVNGLALDVRDTAALARAAAGAEVVVHALNPPYTQAHWRTTAPALLEAGIQVALALRAGLMFPGNVYNFGTTMPAELREDTPQRADTVKGSVRVAMEQRLAHATGDGALRAVVIRAGDFFGGGQGSWLDQLIATKLRQGRMSYPGALDVPTAWAYLPDMARCFVQVAEHRHALPAFETLHFGGYRLTGAMWQAELTAIAHEQGWLPAGRALTTGSLPWPLIRLGGLVRPTWAALSEMRYLWQSPHHLANQKLVGLLGQEPHTAFGHAVRAALGGLRITPPLSGVGVGLH